MTDQGAEIRKYDVAYFTASVDDAEQNKKFAQELSVDYPILSDPTKENAKKFGVLNERGMANRWTFYIDRDGRIAAIDKSVKAATAGEDMVAKLAELKVAMR